MEGPTAAQASMLMNPGVPARVKSLIVSLNVWNEVHSLLNRVHDLISTAQLSRIEVVPETLYQLYNSIRAFDARFSSTLIQVSMYQEAVHISFFAKTFSNRVFDCGELNERLLAPHLSRAALTRSEFRKQLDNAEMELRSFEEMVYSCIASTPPGLSQSPVSKTFLPQPHPLEYVPEILVYDRGTGHYLSSSDVYGAALQFLRNRRQQLLGIAATINNSRYKTHYTQIDLRDFNHELDLIENETAVVVNLQRILSGGRIVDDGKTQTSGFNSALTASAIRTNGQLFQTLRFEPMPLTYHPSPRESARDRTAESSIYASAQNIEPSRGGDGVRDQESNSRTSSRMGARFPSFADIPSSTNPLNTAGPLNNWSSSIDLGTPRHNYHPLNRWNSRGIDPVLSLNLYETNNNPDASDNSSSIYSSVSQPLLSIGTGRGSNNHTRNQEYYSGGRSAFAGRVPIQLMNHPSSEASLRTRASSVSDLLDFERNHLETSFDMSEVRDIASDRSANLLKSVLSKVDQTLQALQRQEQVLAQHTSYIRELMVTSDEMRARMIKLQEDLERAVFPELDGFVDAMGRPTFTTKSAATNDLWRNIEGYGGAYSRRPSNERAHHMNISGHHFEATRPLVRPTQTVPGTRSGSRLTSAVEGDRSRRSVDGSTGHSDTYGLRSGSNSHFMLNNQMPPGNRANNYWDNFKSYSRLNLLSDSKTNLSGLSPGERAEEQFANVTNDDGVGGSPMRRDSRTERPFGTAIRSSLSANFVENLENIGHKKRNKDLKKPFGVMRAEMDSPAHSASSNSSSAGSLNDLMSSTRTFGNPAPVASRSDFPEIPATTRGLEDNSSSLLPSVERGSRSLAASAAALQQSIDEATARCAATHIASLSPPSSLEVDFVSRDEFLQLNSGGGSSAASGNTKSDDGGPSSTSSKRELEKLMANPDDPNKVTDDNAARWSFDMDDAESAVVAKPETDWWPSSTGGGGGGGGGDTLERDSRRDSSEKPRKNSGTQENDKTE